MGMSASQMRYCLISGKKSDVEFQGQQINQQRTTLATQTSAYNTQLLDLKVPTPPSTADYTKTTYSFVSNGETRTVTGTVYDVNTGTYTVNYTTQTTTSQGQSSGTSVFSAAGGVAGAATPPYTTSAGTVLTAVTNALPAAEYASDTSNIALICRDCEIQDRTVTPARNYGDAGYVVPNFYKYTSNGQTRYILARDLAANANAPGNPTNTAISTYNVDDDAAVTQNSRMTGASVTWSDTNRMTSITDAQGHEYSLSVNTKDDESAYEDAYNEYQYQKSLYDQEIDIINSKVSIIQTQDKKLELKLQDLDTQQEALNTEMESVKKVIDKNIEQSFKAFA